MTPHDLKQKFELLNRPGADTDGYMTERLDGESLRIAKTKHGLPALLVQHDGTVGTILEKRRFRNLFVQSNVEMDSSPDLFYAVIELTENNDALIDWFFGVVAALCDRLKQTQSVSQLEEELLYLVELFASFGGEKQATLIGLWAELLVIREAKDPSCSADAWHSETNAKWDFLSGGYGVEVKASIGDKRRHTFSLEQFQEPTNLLLASVILRESEHGLSLSKLLDDVLKRLEEPERSKVQTIALETIGDNNQAASDLRFNLNDAIDDLKFFRAIDVPHIQFPAPAGVTQVKYQSDLSGCTEWSIHQDDSSLWKAVAG